MRDWLRSISWDKLIAEATVKHIVGGVLSLMGAGGLAFLAWIVSPDLTPLGYVVFVLGVLLTLSSALPWGHSASPR